MRQGSKLAVICISTILLCHLIVSHALDSTDTTYKLSPKPATPYILEEGVITNLQGWIRSTKVCPSGWKPYATITATVNPGAATPRLSRFYVLHGFGICIYNIVLYTTTTYEITYIASAGATEFSTPQSGSVFYSALYIMGSYNDTLKNVSWQLFCYPPGFPPPLLYNAAGGTSDPAGTCNSDNPPFKYYDQWTP